MMWCAALGALSLLHLASEGPETAADDAAFVVSFHKYAPQQELADYVADSGVRCRTLARSNAATAS